MFRFSIMSLIGEILQLNGHTPAEKLIFVEYQNSILPKARGYMNSDTALMDLEIRRITRSEVEQLHELEAASYPEDEAASLEKLLYRWKEAPDLMLAAFHGEEMVGYVNGTRYHGDSITDESMKIHIPRGKSVCIHSVVVKPEHRRKGVALRLLRNYVQTVTSEQKDATHILLICKSNLIPLYTRAGFMLRGKSDIVFGKDPWYEMAVNLSDANS